MDNDAPLLLVENLHKSYPTPGEPLVVLDGVNLQTPRGASIAIMGPSGSGKSTLLHIIGALDDPTQGSVHVEGVDPFSLKETERAAFRNTRIGFVFQDHCLLPQLTALENVLTPTLAGRADAALAEERARRLFEQVGLKDRVTHRPAHLSGGERQRVALARALINEPLLLLGDEPTGNLDEKNAGEMAALLAGLQKSEGLTLIMVTHSRDFAAHFGRIYQLRGGRLEEASA